MYVLLRKAASNATDIPRVMRLCWHRIVKMYFAKTN